MNETAADVIEDALVGVWLLKFNGEPLAEVVDEMNRYTALTIEIADPALPPFRWVASLRSVTQTLC